jgi:hypothetical protein
VTRTPDFDELVGADLPGAERERLLRVHDLLVAAGPPPELPAELDDAPRPGTVVALPKSRRRLRLLAIAAALGVLVFAVGFLARGGPDYQTFESLDMSGTAAAAGAHATIDVFDVDAAGNWPMEISVTGLGPTTSGRPYQVWLTRDGKLAALCGSFLAEPDGTTVVPMNAPFRLQEYDSWVVVEEGSKTVLLTT